jgi:TorA maturation chaperone TorD
MLAAMVLHKEVGMGEQRLLFELHRLPWVEQLWKKLDPKTRSEVVSLLAEMGRAALRAQQPARTKERCDES